MKVIYGCRHIGKSTLITEFAKEVINLCKHTKYKKY